MVVLIIRVFADEVLDHRVSKTRVFRVFIELMVEVFAQYVNNTAYKKGIFIEKIMKHQQECSFLKIVPLISCYRTAIGRM